MAQKAEVEAHPHLLEGEKDIPGPSLLFWKRPGAVKFLVLGSHGHGFMGRHLIGSTTERVIREMAHRGLPVPVLVVPVKAGEE